MALIRCKLCDNKISTRAIACPKCGCPNIARSDDSGNKLKNCAECENGGKDGGYACNLCEAGNQSDLLKTATLNNGVRQTGFSATHQHMQDERVDVAIVAKIEDLDVDDQMKNLFMKIALAKSSSTRFGLPQLEYHDEPIRYFSGLNSTGSLGSNLAFVLGPFVYFAAGLWKKGALLTAIVLLISLGIILSTKIVGAILALLIVIVYLVCYCSVKYDRYRQLVLDEEFWW